MSQQTLSDVAASPNPLAFMALFALCLFAIATLARSFPWLFSTGASGSGRGRLRNPANQIDAVAAVDFEVVPLLGHDEATCLAMIEAALHEMAPGWRVMARTSLEEILRPASGDGPARNRALASIHAKRLDFAIFDTRGRLAAALGWQARAPMIGFARDMVRREAIRRAGLPYIELSPAMSPEDLCLRLLELTETHAG